MQNILAIITSILHRAHCSPGNIRTDRLEILLTSLHLSPDTIQEPMINLDDLTDDDITKLLKESASLSLKQFILVLLILLDKSHCEGDSITKYLGDLRVLYDIHKDRMCLIQMFLYNIVFEIIQNAMAPKLAVMGYKDPDWLAVQARKRQ